MNLEKQEIELNGLLKIFFKCKNKNNKIKYTYRLSSCLVKTISILTVISKSSAKFFRPWDIKILNNFWVMISLKSICWRKNVALNILEYLKYWMKFFEGLSFKKDKLVYIIFLSISWQVFFLRMHGDKCLIDISMKSQSADNYTRLW